MGATGLSIRPAGKPVFRFVLTPTVARLVLVGGLPMCAIADPFPSTPQPAIGLVRFEVTVDVSPVRATLYYRTPGSRSYLPVDLEHEAGQVMVEFPQEIVRAPGVEYFVVVEGAAAGARQTFPTEFPQYSPYLLRVEAAQVEIAALSSLSGRPDDLIRISVPANQPVPRVLLDGTDITDNMSRSANELIYSPAAPLAEGDHQVTLIQPAGREPSHYAYRVTRESGMPAAERAGGDYVELAGRASFNYGGDLGGRNSQGSRSSANLHIEGGMQRGAFNGQWSGVDVRWVDGAEDPVTLSSGYLLTGDYKNVNVQMGDVTVSEVPLIASGFARRGLQVGLGTDNSMTRFFNVRTDPIEGFNMGLSFDEEQQTFGVAHERSLGDAWMLHAALTSGQEESAAGYNTATLLSPSKGDSAGLQLRGVALGTSVDLEYALSDFDEDVLDDEGSARDDAYRVSLNRNFRGLNVGAGYLRYGSEYATIANPNFTGDRESIDLSLSSGWRIFSWSLSGSETFDNVDRDPTRPRVYSNALSASLSAAPAGWPLIQLNFTEARQDSDREPDDVSVVNNTNSSLSVALSHNVGNVAWNLTSAFGELDDKLDPSRSTDIATYSLSTSYSRQRFSIAPNFTWNEIDGDLKKDRSLLATLNASIPLADRILLSTQLSWQHNDATDDSVDNTLTGGSVRVAWTLQDVLGGRIPDWLNFQFGLSATYNKVDDRINPDIEDEEVTVLLTFNLGAPFDFNVRRNLNDPMR